MSNFAAEYIQNCEWYKTLTRSELLIINCITKKHSQLRQSVTVDFSEIEKCTGCSQATIFSTIRKFKEELEILKIVEGGRGTNLSPTFKIVGLDTDFQSPYTACCMRCAGTGSELSPNNHPTLEV